MSYTLEPNPALLSPDYWDGKDIAAANSFALEPEPSVRLSVTESRIASSLLRFSLGYVITDEYEEVLNPPQTRGFDPDPKILEDGTVLVIDRESLTKYGHLSSGETEWRIPEIGTGGSPISPPYAAYWRENQGRSANRESVNFGDDQAVFPDLFTVYNRYLQWGLLLTGDDRKRLIATWALSEPKAFLLGVKVSPSSDDAEKLPVNVGPGTASLGPDVETGDLSVRLISRVRSISVIKLDYRQEPPQKSPGFRDRLAQKLADLKVALDPGPGRIPIPIPVRP